MLEEVDAIVFSGATNAKPFEGSLAKQGLFRATEETETSFQEVVELHEESRTFVDQLV